MRVFSALDAIGPADFQFGTAVAIGKFDGVHKGHQTILARLTAAARERGAESVVFTFENNPMRVLHPEKCPPQLMSPAQRIEQIAAAQVDACVMVPFDTQLSQVTADDYVTHVLVGTLHACHIIVGSDFRFGHRGSGDVEMLGALGKVHGFSVEVIESVDDERLGRISSTGVRETLSTGDVAGAARMIGRNVEVRGEVVHGDARGRDLGFPTANLGGTIEGLVPADGVYAGWVVIDGVRRPTAISVGVNPTFTPGGQSRVEAFLLDFEGDLYGKKMTVEFVEHLRGMETYRDIDALVTQMHADVHKTREVLHL